MGPRSFHNIRFNGVQDFAMGQNNGGQPANGNGSNGGTRFITPVYPPFFPIYPAITPPPVVPQYPVTEVAAAPAISTGTVLAAAAVVGVAVIAAALIAKKA